MYKEKQQHTPLLSSFFHTQHPKPLALTDYLGRRILKQKNLFQKFKREREEKIRSSHT